MKRILSTNAAVALTLSILLLSCSDNPAVRLRYEAEKMYFDAEKELKEAQTFSRQLSASQIGQLHPAYSECIEFCYNALDSIDAIHYPVEHNELQYLTYQSSMRLSRLFFSVRQLDSSIAISNRLLKEVSLKRPELLPTCLNLGQALQASGQWDSALTVYNYVINEFYPPMDNLGELILPAFTLPRHVYRIVSTIGDSAASAGEFSRAVAYYSKLADDHPGTKLFAAACVTLADLYDETRQWDLELKTLAIVADSSLPGFENVLLRMADVYGGRLDKFDTALAIYTNLLDGLQPDDTATAPTILFKICLVKMDQEKYEESRAIISRLKKDYPMFFASTPMPQYTLARSLEMEGNWERAESEYSLLIEKYRGSDEAMMALLYMIDYLREIGRTTESNRWFQEAEKHYTEVAFRRAGTLAEAKAMFYRAELRRRNEEYQRSADILLELFNKFPESEPGRQALLAAANLYRDELKDRATGDSLINVWKRYLPNAGSGL